MTADADLPAGSTAGVAVLGPEPGAVSVTVEVPSGARGVWEALTAPRVVARWLGQLSAPLVADTMVRLDFEDGDFFDLQVRRATPWRILEWRWRFLGVGPLDTVRWRIEEVGPNSARVTVNDTHPDRSVTEATELGAGWVDFLDRLAAHLHTGARTRYLWRAELDGSVELPAGAVRLFEPAMLARWLPLGGHTLEPGVCFHADLEVGALEVRTVEWVGPTGAQFVVGPADGGVGTGCRLSLLQRGTASVLEFSHTGWSTLASTDEARRRLRARLAGVWVKTLERACRVCIQFDPWGDAQPGSVTAR
jgi:uncharacterized protein YndB with AHSA1/START domain